MKYMALPNHRRIAVIGKFSAIKCPQGTSGAVIVATLAALASRK
jgi:hypothetical protein